MSSRVISGAHQWDVILDFANGTRGASSCESDASGNELQIGYNRRLDSGFEVADTYAPTLESNVASTIIQRAITVQNALNGTSPSNNLSVYIDGVLDQTIGYNTTIGTVGTTNWFNIDLSAIGTRKLIRIEGTESAKNFYNQYELELNYIY